MRKAHDGEIHYLDVYHAQAPLIGHCLRIRLSRPAASLLLILADWTCEPNEQRVSWSMGSKKVNSAQISFGLLVPRAIR